MQAPSDAKPYDEINITPMLDLAYVLMVIFILMCTAAIQGMKVNLPRASKGGNLGKPKTKAISVNNEGRVFLDTIPVSMEELQQRLLQHKTVIPDFPVVVAGDGSAQYQKIMDVLDIVGRMGISQVGLATKTTGK